MDLKMPSSSHSRNAGPAQPILLNLPLSLQPLLLAHPLLSPFLFPLPRYMLRNFSLAYPKTT